MLLGWTRLAPHCGPSQVYLLLLAPSVEHAFPHRPTSLVADLGCVSFLVGMAETWTHTQGLHPLGADIATLPSKSKARKERPGGLQTREYHGIHHAFLPPPLSQPRATGGHWIMALESQVLVPTLQSTSSLLECNMGLILPAVLALWYMTRILRTWV